MTLFQQLLRAIKYGRKQLRATDCACSKVVPFEVSTVPFYELVQIELAKLDAIELATKSFFNRFIVLARVKACHRAFKTVLDKLQAKTNTHQQTAQQNATNSILFRHFSRDNTSQIDSTAQLV